MGAPFALFIRDLQVTPHGGWGLLTAIRNPSMMPTLTYESRKESTMLYWALMFLVIALVAAVFGFGGIASTATGMAQILFVIALVLFVVSLFAGFLRRNL
jgi:uncharacterized membrane protein YtjA (UPF0391 family)